MLYVNPASNALAFRGGEALSDSERTKEVLQEFEHVFINQLLKEMRKTVPEGGLLEKSSRRQYFEEMFDDHLAGEMAKSGQFGIAKQMAEQLARAEQARAASPAKDATEGLPLRPERGGVALPQDGAGIALKKVDEGIALPEKEGIPLRGAAGSRFEETSR